MLVHFTFLEARVNEREVEGKREGEGKTGRGRRLGGGKVHRQKSQILSHSKLSTLLLPSPNPSELASIS